MEVFELHLPLVAGGFYLLQPAVYNNNFYFWWNYCRFTKHTEQDRSKNVLDMYIKNFCWSSAVVGNKLLEKKK